MCVLHSLHFSTFLTILQGLNSYLWAVATVLDKTGLVAIPLVVGVAAAGSQSRDSFVTETRELPAPYSLRLCVGHLRVHSFPSQVSSVDMRRPDCVCISESGAVGSVVVGRKA